MGRGAQRRGGSISPVMLCISVHSYKTLVTEHEALTQKYLHLMQVVETEKTESRQLRQQLHDGKIEIERLKTEVSTRWGPQARSTSRLLQDGVGGATGQAPSLASKLGMWAWEESGVVLRSSHLCAYQGPPGVCPPLHCFWVVLYNAVIARTARW